MTKQQKYELNLQKHLRELNALGFIGDFVELQIIEKKGRRLTLDYSNGRIDTDKFQAKDSLLEKQLSRLFVGGKLPDGVFTNSDPRGHYIKLDSEFNTYDQKTYQYRISCYDWGRNGILCPDKDSLT